MKIKLADSSRLDFEDNLVPLFDLLAGYRETFGNDAGGAEIDLSGNEELSAPAFERAWAAIHNPLLSSATIAAGTMRTLNYLGYKTCAPLVDPLPSSDTYIAFCACYTRGVTVDMSGHARLPAKEEFERAVRIHTIIAGGEILDEHNFERDLRQAWHCVARHGVKSLELFRFVEKYGEYNDRKSPLPLAIPAFWRLPSAAGMMSRMELIWHLEELTRCADDPIELRAAVIHFVSGCGSNDSRRSVLPETRDELDIWLARDPDLSRIPESTAPDRELTELARLVDAEFPDARFCARMEMAIAIVKDYPERYNSAAAAISEIPHDLAFLRLMLNPPKIAAASDPRHNRALLRTVGGFSQCAVRVFIWHEIKPSILARGAWGHSVMRYFASPGNPKYWLEDVFASRDPGWLLILRDQVAAAIKRYPANVIKFIGSVEAYDVFCEWRECPLNVFVEGDFIVGIRVMAKLVAAGRATESDAEANLRGFLLWFRHSRRDANILDNLFAADAMLPDGVVSRMLHSGCYYTDVARALIRMGAKWNYDDIRENWGRDAKLERLIA